MNVLVDQLLGRNRQQALEFVVYDHIMSTTQCSGRVIPDTPPNLAFSF